MYNKNNQDNFNDVIDVEEIQKENYRREKKNRFFKKIKKVTCFSALAFALGVSASIGYNSALQNKNEQVETVTSAINKSTSNAILTTSNNSQNSVTTTVIDVSNVVEDTMPSIVAVNCITYTQGNKSNMYGFYGFGGYNHNQQVQETESCGTGIIIGKNDSELLIVTNYHVVEDTDKVSVAFVDNTSAECTVKGYDSDADLAVIAVPLKNITSDTLSNINIATLGDSDELRVGETAIAIGNALGYGQSVTTGVISALERQVELTDKTMTLIQTDAAINPGNSGGALLNSKGEVIGINTVKYSSDEVEGMGYAIPISDALPIIKELMNEETIPESERAYLGISGQEITEQYQAVYGMPAGVYITSVGEGTPAQKAGLRQGTIITGIDNKKITSMEQISKILNKHKAGDVIEMTILQANNGEYKEKTISVTLGSRVDEM